jgi:hypothetical protein
LYGMREYAEIRLTMLSAFDTLAQRASYLRIAQH